MSNLSKLFVCNTLYRWYLVQEWIFGRFPKRKRSKRSRKPTTHAIWNEPRHEKTNKLSVCPAKTQMSLGIRPVWSESSLSAWGNLWSLAVHWTHSDDSDQTGRMPRLIWVFAGCTLILLVLSCRGSLLIPATTLRADNTAHLYRAKV